MRSQARRPARPGAIFATADTRRGLEATDCGKLSGFRFQQEKRMPLIDLVSGALADGARNPEPRFDQIAAQASPDLLGAGIAAALRALPPDALAPTFEALFVRSDALQQAALLNHLLAAEPETALSAAGGALGCLLAPGGAPGSALRGNGFEIAA
ncbi:MAG: hypothetical protein ACLGHY_12675, partial [Gammaproteobacteria bacterium]